MYKPSELHAFLKEKGLYAKKGLSQNFLIDGNIVQKILSTALIHEGDFVVEIGPGPGALTQALLAKGARVLAVEMDPLFARELERLQTPDARLEVVCQDILTFPLAERLEKHKAKVVANLPYHITTPILVQLLPLHGLVESLTLMVQKEFAERMFAQPGTSNYSSFTVFLQFYADVVSHFAVSPNCFSPRPSIVSSVVHCKLHPPALETGVEGFFLLTRTAFGQRRKMLRSTLQSLYTKELIEEALVSIHRCVTVRPEELSLQEFIMVYTKLHNH